MAISDTASTISPGGFLLIWCDDDESQGPLHTNFKLSIDGEEIKLLKSDGVTVIDSISFGPQTIDQFMAGFQMEMMSGVLLPTPGFQIRFIHLLWYIPENFTYFNKSI